MSNFPQFGHVRRGDFLLADGIDHLNHGSYGATPLVVLDAARQWQTRMEADPSAFLPQTPLTQLMPFEHTLLSTQDVRHFVPLSSHRNGEQGCWVPGIQAPSAVQRDASMICCTWQRAALRWCCKRSPNKKFQRSSLFRTRLLLPDVIPP